MPIPALCGGFSSSQSKPETRLEKGEIEKEGGSCNTEIDIKSCHPQENAKIISKKPDLKPTVNNIENKCNECENEIVHQCTLDKHNQEKHEHTHSPLQEETEPTENNIENKCNECNEIVHKCTLDEHNQEKHEHTLPPLQEEQLEKDDEREKESDRWKSYNAEFEPMVQQINEKLSDKEITPIEAATEFNQKLSEFLETKEEIKKEIKQFFKHKPKSSKDIDEARKLKNKLRKLAKKKCATAQDKSVACKALRHYEYLLGEQNKYDEVKEIRKQENSYKKNFYKFAKETTKGTYGKERKSPSYSKEEADQFYKQKYSKSVNIDTEKLDWFPKVSTPEIPYNLNPYNSEDIVATLKNKTQDSAPGDDEIVYKFLTQLPSTHKFLATLFTSIRDSGEAPEVWGSSKIVLILKDEDNENTHDPTTFRMISLTANVGKLYHTLEASRSISYMIMNKFLDPSAQKAYINGINGCVEHVQVVQEVIQHAKANHKTVYITWFDLVDAFGSLSHMLIPHVFRHYHFPSEIISYIQNIYSKLRGKIKTQDWETELFDFLQGAFQGCPYSGIIFLICFNPLIEYIKNFKESQGYKVEETHVITTPFADDFNLISKNKIKHQELIENIEEKAKTMGFSFKPTKCRSLSIYAGKTTNVTFVITSSEGNNIKIPIETVHSRPHKFLGSQITYSNSPKDYFKHFYELLEKKLKNISQSKVRGEHKLAVFERYALPSMRYHLSIHDLHETHLAKLDNLTRKYIKQWLNYPTKGVTDVGIFHPYLLKVKQPSQVYKEGHTGNLVLMKLKGDEIVNACIDSKIKRETKWKKKSSTIVESNTLIENLVATNSISLTTSASTRQANIINVKNVVRKSVQAHIKDTWNEKVKRLTMQGDFANLLIEEQESVTWQSVIRQMPRHVLAFAARLSTNSLNSPDNLARWGKRKIGSCPLCKATHGTLAHIVNFCPVALKQGRYTWRHDSVLNEITKKLKSSSTNNTQIYADLPGHKINGSTIPADILVSSGEGSRPDLVLVNREKKEIALMELTISLPQNTQAANKKKALKYTHLDIALREQGFKVYLVPFEVCSNGHITKTNQTNIQNTLRRFRQKVKKNDVLNLSKIALLCTMSIFHAYHVTDWVDPPLLSP